ncbi:MAG: photoactive yellow protein [Myxococcota bacterium]|jgi:photoactive yellow protein
MTLQETHSPSPTFEAITAEALVHVDIDTLPFGVVEMDGDGRVIRYSRFESELSGLEVARVMGRHFFSEVGPCMNNFMVAQKLEGADELDEIVDYVLTLRIAPTAVRLRLLRTAEPRRRYLLVHRS